MLNELIHVFRCVTEPTFTRSVLCFPAGLQCPAHSLSLHSSGMTVIRHHILHRSSSLNDFLLLKLLNKNKRKVNGKYRYWMGTAGTDRKLTRSMLPGSWAVSVENFHGTSVRQFKLVHGLLRIGARLIHGERTVKYVLIPFILLQHWENSCRCVRNL